MKPVPYESELGRSMVLVPLSVAGSMKPMERLKTVGYRMAICSEIQNLSYRKANRSFNRNHHRTGTSQELSVGTMVEDIEQEGRDIRRAKAEKTRAILKSCGFDPATGLYPGDTLPDRFRNNMCEMVVFNSKELLSHITPGWMGEEDGSDCEYSLPDTEVFRVRKKRRGNRHEVPADRKEHTCIRFFNWLNGVARREYYGIIHDWAIEKSSGEVVYISIDVVFVDQQAETRSPGGTNRSADENRPEVQSSGHLPASGSASEEEERKRIGHVNVRIEADNVRYYITSLDMEEAYRELIAFLLHSGLCTRYMIFFLDGETALFQRIERYFGNRWMYSVYLDWTHLQHKVYERMSNIIKAGKVPDPRGRIEYYKQKSKAGMIRKQDRIAQSQLYARELLRMLWVGNVQEAIDYLNRLDPAILDNRKEQGFLITYLENKRKWITCYALRRQVGLRNSSNGVEGENRVLVADRQKHNGTAWRPTGSGNLSAITCLFYNNEQEEWFFHDDIRFSMAT